MRKIVRKPWEAKIQAALDFANLHHRYVPRKGTGTPYIIHPLQVVDRMGHWGIRPEDHPEVWVAGLLHDVDEDTDATIYEIEALFGQTVGYYVSELTFRGHYPDETRAEYAKAKEEYLGSFIGKSTQSLAIKIADRLCNVEDFLRTDEKYAVKYFDKAKPLWEAYKAKVDVGDLEAIFGDTVVEGIAIDVGMVTNRINSLRAA